MTKEQLQQFSIKELESISYELTSERQKLRSKALLVQQVLSQKIEQKRVAEILGKPLASIKPAAINSQESA